MFDGQETRDMSKLTAVIIGVVICLAIFIGEYFIRVHKLVISPRKRKTNTSEVSFFIKITTFITILVLLVFFMDVSFFLKGINLDFVKSDFVKMIIMALIENGILFIFMCFIVCAIIKAILCILYRMSHNGMYKSKRVQSKINVYYLLVIFFVAIRFIILACQQKVEGGRIPDSLQIFLSQAFLFLLFPIGALASVDSRPKQAVKRIVNRFKNKEFYYFIPLFPILLVYLPLDMIGEKWVIIINFTLLSVAVTALVIIILGEVYNRNKNLFRVIRFKLLTCRPFSLLPWRHKWGYISYKREKNVFHIFNVNMDYCGENKEEAETFSKQLDKIFSRREEAIDYLKDRSYALEQFIKKEKNCIITLEEKEKQTRIKHSNKHNIIGLVISLSVFIAGNAISFFPGIYENIPGIARIEKHIFVFLLYWTCLIVIVVFILNIISTCRFNKYSSTLYYDFDYDKELKAYINIRANTKKSNNEYSDWKDAITAKYVPQKENENFYRYLNRIYRQKMLYKEVLNIVLVPCMIGIIPSVEYLNSQNAFSKFISTLVIICFLVILFTVENINASREIYFLKDFCEVVYGITYDDNKANEKFTLFKNDREYLDGDKR